MKVEIGHGLVNFQDEPLQRQREQEGTKRIPMLHSRLTEDLRGPKEESCRLTVAEGHPVLDLGEVKSDFVQEHLAVDGVKGVLEVHL